MHDRIVVAEEVTKDLCFSLSVRGRREGREADVFEDKKGALRSTERCMTNLTPLASRQLIALLTRVDVAIPGLRGGWFKGRIKKSGRGEWKR
jgi:hypothetical protein